MTVNCRAILGVKILLVFGAAAFGADWPQWRGANRDGCWEESGVIERFSGPELAILWRAKIGNGYSGPTVAEGRVYVTDRVSRPRQIERVHCFDARTGKNIWSYPYECSYRKVGYPNGPRAAVTVDSGRAYSLGTMGHLFCFDAATGEVAWGKDLDAEYDCRIPTWGIAAAPLVENELVIVHVGGREDASLIGFEKVTGRERWRALGDNASYSAPIIIEQAGRRVLLCWTGERVVGVAPSTGRLLWEHPFKQRRMIMNIATPVYRNGYLFVSSFFDGSLLLKVSEDRPAVERVWRREGANERETDSLHCCISTPVIQGDYIYGVDSYGELRCLELGTGERVWESLDAVPKARWANIHMVTNAEKVWMFNERGELIISRLSPSGFEQISRAKLIEPTKGQLNQRGGVCWAHPAFAGRRIYARNDEELVCADLSAKGEAELKRQLETIGARRKR